MVSEGVKRVERCELTLGTREWGWAARHADAIDRHWSARHAQNPAMFNGTIFLVAEERLGARVLEAELLRADFKSYLYWRDSGFPSEAGVRDGFGSALIRSGEGHVVLGRQRAGNINAGFAYLPGGFIDENDLRPDGSIDIDGSIARELREETGLSAGDVEMREGFIITHCGQLTSIAREFVSFLGADELQAKIRANLSAQHDAELADMVIVREAADIDGAAAPVHAYAQVLLRAMFAGAIR